MKERIRELAEQAGIEFDDDFTLEPETIYYLTLSDFEKFAELVRAEEREACALIVEHKQVPLNWNDRECFAKAIRARGEK